MEIIAGHVRVVGCRAGGSEAGEGQEDGGGEGVREGRRGSRKGEEGTDARQQSGVCVGDGLRAEGERW